MGIVHHSNGLIPLTSTENRWVIIPIRCVDANLSAAQLVNPDVRFAGVAVNTKALDAAQANKFLADTEQRLGLPCADPMRGGVDRIVDNLP